LVETPQRRPALQHRPIDEAQLWPVWPTARQVSARWRPEPGEI